MHRLTGTKDLIFDAIEETTNLVERMHALVSTKSIRPLTLIQPLAAVAQAVQAVHDTTAAGVYETIRLVNRGIQKLLDAGIELAGHEILNNAHEAEKSLATPLSSDAEGSPSWLIDHSQAILNGIYGDYLDKKGNTLDLGMHLRDQGQVLPLEKEALKQRFENATGKVCVFIHGLCCTEWIWSISAKEFYGDPNINFGSLLKTDLGFTPVYVRYNTGRHVSENGQRLSELLSHFTALYPLNIEKIILVGHSMGGLVARSAAHYGSQNHAPWVKKLQHIFCVGSPNLGAPMEKALNLLGSILRAFNTAGTQAPAQVLNARSAGIKDLRFGYTIDDEWRDKDPDALLKNNRHDLPFVEGVGYSFIAGTITEDPDHPLGVLVGDLLVRVPSAAGRAFEPARRIPFRSGRVISGLSHLHLANHPDIYQVIRSEASPL
jgi:triacylglycerol lipase